MNAFPNRVFLQLAILLSLVAWPCATAWAQSPDLIPQEYRIKIDDIDTSLAPEITIRATFLDKKNLPVNPSKITALTVYNDDDVVSTKPKISTIKNSQVPIDLAIIVPISQRFSERELDEMKKSMSHIIEQARPKEDNVAGFFDDGRAINVAPLGNSSDVVTLLKQVKPQAQPSFLYSSLDKALETLSDPAHFRPDARRAIILVTDAFDTYTYRSHDVQREIYDAYLNARANGIRIFVVMYKPFIRGLIPSFEGLSRKTGGTYRYADFPEQIAKGIDYAWGEIYGELLITFRDSTLREGQTATYKIEATREGGMSVMSNPYREVRIDSLKFNWKAFWIGCGIVAGLLVVALIVFLIVRHQRKKREEMEAAIEEQRIQEGIERGEVPQMPPNDDERLDRMHVLCSRSRPRARQSPSRTARKSPSRRRKERREARGTHLPRLQSNDDATMERMHVLQGWNRLRRRRPQKRRRADAIGKRQKRRTARQNLPRLRTPHESPLDDVPLLRSRCRFETASRAPKRRPQAAG